MILTLCVSIPNICTSHIPVLIPAKGNSGISNRHRHSGCGAWVLGRYMALEGRVLERGDNGVQTLRIIGHACVRMRKRSEEQGSGGIGGLACQAANRTFSGQREPRQAFKQVSVVMKMGVAVTVLMIACSSEFL